MNRDAEFEIPNLNLRFGESYKESRGTTKKAFTLQQKAPQISEVFRIMDKRKFVLHTIKC